MKKKHNYLYSLDLPFSSSEDVEACGSTANRSDIECTRGGNDGGEGDKRELHGV